MFGIGDAIGLGIKTLFGIEGEERRQSDADAQRRENTELQREFAQNGLRWKVEDAQRAGLSPLFAVGGAGAAYSPNPVTVGSDSTLADLGQNLSRAVGAQSTSAERALQNAQLRVLESQADQNQAMAFYYASEASRGIQGNMASGPFPAVVGPMAGNDGLVTPKAPDAIAPRVGDASTVSTQNPFWERHQLDDGTVIDLPRSDEGPAEAAENPTMWPAIVARNINKHGARWISDIATSPASTDRRSMWIGDFIDWVKSQARGAREVSRKGKGWNDVQDAYNNIIPQYRRRYQGAINRSK